MITTEQIRELRDVTGVPVVQCKKALEESNGDMEKAILLLRKISGDVASKKAERNLGSGTVASYVHSNHGVGSMVILSCETDFVAKNEEFMKLAYNIAMHVAATNPTYLKREDVPKEEMALVTDTLTEEIPKDKPAEMQAKILEGKINDYLKTKVLLEQPYIKDETVTILDLTKGAVQKFGERTEVAKFVRFSVAR
ncbi:MAG: elongation factor Ts [Candidatus Paceibacterota bacterium]|jgi:elongation factor Ts|nr:elongation factor Ts [Candidatus Paceibacterota bacterium]